MNALWRDMLRRWAPWAALILMLGVAALAYAYHTHHEGRSA